MLLHLDPVGGVAGDMFAAALLDAWPELEDRLIAALEGAGIARLASVRRCDHRDHAMAGSRFEVTPVARGSSEPHRYRDIVAFIQAAELAAPVRAAALDIFARLAGAEAEVHGVALDAVSFHEVGAWDSIADIVSAAWLIHALGTPRWSCAPLPLGHGRVRTAHGLLPVPAPATARLLAGMPVFRDAVEGERITPTGAAILAHLDPEFAPLTGVARIERTGTGFGTSVFDGISNVLRVLVFEQAAAGSDTVAVCQFEVDDQVGEDLAVALDNLRAVAGVLDVVQCAVHGKKGRIAFQVQVLVRPAALDDAIDACLRETTTLGVRWHLVERTLLDRDTRDVDAGGHRVRVKRARRPRGAVTAKAEIDDLADAEGGHQARQRRRVAAEAAAIEVDDGS